MADIFGAISQKLQSSASSVASKAEEVSSQMFSKVASGAKALSDIASKSSSSESAEDSSSEDKESSKAESSESDSEESKSDENESSSSERKSEERGESFSSSEDSSSESSYIDPPAAATASAANTRYQNRLMRLQQQAEMREQLRQQYATFYMEEASLIEQMKTQLNAEKMG